MSKPHVVIFVKIAANNPSRSPYHVGGLAANGLHSVAVLQSMGIDAEIQTVVSFDEVMAFLKNDPTVTHAIVEAVWVKLEQARQIEAMFPNLVFVVRSHSKIGFLQVEPEAIPIARALMQETGNAYFSANNSDFARALTDVYGRCLYLPNLYDLRAPAPKQQLGPGTLRIASFGATRLLKLHPTAALAALQVARELKMPLEFYVNSDKTPGGNSVRNTIRNMFDGLDWAKLVEVPWQDPITFRQTIASMDLVFQLSATETFCLVAADAVSSGVPVVVSPAIVWIDDMWQVKNPDDTCDVAEVAKRVLMLPHTVKRSQSKSLKQFVEASKNVWLNFLNVKPKRRWLLW